MIFRRFGEKKGEDPEQARRYLCFLCTVHFIPNQMRNGEIEFYAIDDRDDRVYYVVESPDPAAKGAYRITRKQPAEYRDIPKVPGGRKYAGISAENWRTYLAPQTEEACAEARIPVYDRVFSTAEEERRFLHVLGSTALSSEDLWGKCECVAVDERDNKAYYIITYTDGRVSESVRYHTKEEVPYAQIPTRYLGAAFEGINETNWRRFLKPAEPENGAIKA